MAFCVLYPEGLKGERNRKGREKMGGRMEVAEREGERDREESERSEWKEMESATYAEAQKKGKEGRRRKGRPTERQRPGEKAKERRKQGQGQQGQCGQTSSGTPERQTDREGWRKKVGGRKGEHRQMDRQGRDHGPET